MLVSKGKSTLHPAPSNDAPAFAEVETGANITPTGDPVEKDGWIWRKVEGWVRERSADGQQILLEAPAPSPGPQTKPPELSLFITPTIAQVKLRDVPVSGQQVGLVNRGDVVEVIAPVASEATTRIGVEGQWVKIRTANQQEGHTAAWFYSAAQGPARLAPEPSAPTQPAKPATPKFYLIANGQVRVRATPGDGQQVGVVAKGEIVEIIESIEEAKPKIGVQGQWIKIRTLPGVEGFTAGWFYDTYEGELPTQANLPPLIAGTNIVGINLDVFNPLGKPDPKRLGNVGWVRFLYNVSLNPDKQGVHDGRYGNTDIEATFRRYQPVLKQYADAGKKVLLVFTHQTYGEGRGYNLGDMGEDKWHELSDKLAEMLGKIAGQYKGQNLVHAFQIWNEQDAHKGARASIPLEPRDYGYMLTKVIQSVRGVDPNILIITGGHASGPGKGGPYARQTLAFMPSGLRPDGIAAHPYGRGAPESDPRYMHFGNIDEEVNTYAAIMPGKPVWFTEWGVLDAPNEPPNDILRYSREFIRRLKTVHASKVAAAMWYAWGQGMDNGYGIVDPNDGKRGNLTDEYVKL